MEQNTRGDGPGRSGGFKMLVLGPLLMGGVALMALGGLRVWRAEQSGAWPTAPGTVQVSRVVEASALRPRAEVRYSYEVDGKVLTGWRVRFGDAWKSRSAAGAAEDVAQYPVGSSVVVRHEPGFPMESVLEPGATVGDWLFVMIGAAPLSLGILALVGLSRSRCCGGGCSSGSGGAESSFWGGGGDGGDGGGCGGGDGGGGGD
jgi:hypothetical protein